MKLVQIADPLDIHPRIRQQMHVVHDLVVVDVEVAADRCRKGFHIGCGLGELQRLAEDLSGEGDGIPVHADVAASGGPVAVAVCPHSRYGHVAFQGLVQIDLLLLPQVPPIDGVKGSAVEYILRRPCSG